MKLMTFISYIIYHLAFYFPFNPKKKVKKNSIKLNKLCRRPPQYAVAPAS